MKNCFMESHQIGDSMFQKDLFGQSGFEFLINANVRIGFEILVQTRKTER